MWFNALNFAKDFIDLLLPTVKYFLPSVFANVEADSQEADIRSRDFSVPHNAPPLHALIIAVDDYLETDVTCKLLGAINDAKAIHDYLRRVLGVPPSQIKTLYDAEASRYGILHALRALADDDKINKGDPILIYFAGHGATELTPASWKIEDPYLQMIVPQNYGKYAHGIRDRTIARLIDRISEKKGDNITVIFDCCFSGSADRGEINDPTHRVRGFWSDKRQPKDLDDEFLKGCPDAKSRAAGPAQGFAHTGIYSHILLAACGAEERAQERGRRGAFTKALVDTLMALDVEKTTYTNLISRIPRLSGQNPQCFGHNMNRILFDSRAPARGRPYYSIRKEGSCYVIGAGAANGITVGAQFTLYKDNDYFSGTPVVLLEVVETNPFDAKLKAISKIQPDAIILSSIAVQTHAGPEESLRLHIVDNKNLNGVRKAVLKQMHGIGPVQRRISPVDKDKAELEIAYESGRIVFNILDMRVKGHGFSRIPYWIDPVGNPESDQKKVEDIPAIIRGAAHYYWHLRRTAAKDGKRGQLQSRVNIEFTKLEQDPEMEYDDQLHRVFRPTGGNLNQDGALCLVVNKEDRYGFKITNKLKIPLYMSVFYFDNNDFSIQLLYGCPDPNSRVDPQLRPEGTFTLGYDSSGVPPLRFSLREGQDKEVGFIKLFISTEQMDLSNVECESPFENARPLRRDQNDAKAPAVWDTILLTVVLRR